MMEAAPNVSLIPSPRLPSDFRQPSGGAGDAALGNQASSGCRLTAALLAMGVRHIEASLPPFDVAELRLARTFLATFP